MSKIERQRQRRKAQSQAKAQTPIVEQAVETNAPELKRDNQDAQSGNKSNLREWLVAGVGAATLICVGFQTWVMRGQLTQMEGNSAQTDKIIVEAGRASKAQEDSLKQAKTALDFTIEQGRRDQRAWVGIKSVDVDPMEAGQPFRLTMNITNSGKTPANDVTHPGFIAIVDRLADSPADIMQALGYPSASDQTNKTTLFPNAEAGIPIETSVSLKSEWITEIKTEKRYVYIIGDIFYSDAFGEKHVTRYFQRYSPKINKFGAVGAGAHNDAN